MFMRVAEKASRLFYPCFPRGEIRKQNVRKVRAEKDVMLWAFMGLYNFVKASLMWPFLGWRRKDIGMHLVQFSFDFQKKVVF